MQQEYLCLGRIDKGLVRYLAKMTGLGRAQVTCLISPIVQSARTDHSGHQLRNSGLSTPCSSLSPPSGSLNRGLSWTRPGPPYPMTARSAGNAAVSQRTDRLIGNKATV